MKNGHHNPWSHCYTPTEGWHRVGSLNVPLIAGIRSNIGHVNSIRIGMDVWALQSIIQAVSHEFSVNLNLVWSFASELIPTQFNFGENFKWVWPPYRFANFCELKSVIVLSNKTVLDMLTLPNRTHLHCLA